MIRHPRWLRAPEFPPPAFVLFEDGRTFHGRAFGAIGETFGEAVFATGINLYFYYGKSLPDPHKLLKGEGTQGAFIRLESIALLDRPEVIELLDAAVREGDVPLPATGRGITIVKSISAKQKPRRPRKRATPIPPSQSRS